MNHTLRIENRQTPWLSLVLVDAVQMDGPENDDPVFCLFARIPDLSIRLGRIAATRVAGVAAQLASLGEVYTAEYLHATLTAFWHQTERDTLRCTMPSSANDLRDKWTAVIDKWHSYHSAAGTLLPQRAEDIANLQRLR